MPVRKAEATWTGPVTTGTGHVKSGSGAIDVRFSFNTRMGDEPGTNPEELIGSAHAGCFSMALSAALGQAGFAPRAIHTTAHIHFEKQPDGWAITKSVLSTEGDVPGITPEKFVELANAAKDGCPVSKALKGVQITLEAKLV